MGKSALRRCLLCRLFFNSSSPSERICSPCRKKVKIIQRSVNMECISLTPEMERHIRIKEEEVFPTSKREKSCDFDDAVGKCLDTGDTNFDDSRIYEELETEDEEGKEEEEEAVKPVRKKRVLKAVQTSSTPIPKKKPAPKVIIIGKPCSKWKPPRDNIFEF